jgi:hypothetical protein
MMALDAIGSDGQALDLDSAPTTLTYNSDGTLATASIVWVGNTYVQTFTYTSGKLTSISAWVKQ